MSKVERVVLFAALILLGTWIWNIGGDLAYLRISNRAIEANVSKVANRPEGAGSGRRPEPVLEGTLEGRVRAAVVSVSSWETPSQWKCPICSKLEDMDHVHFHGGVCYQKR